MVPSWLSHFDQTCRCHLGICEAFPRLFRSLLTKWSPATGLLFCLHLSHEPLSSRLWSDASSYQSGFLALQTAIVGGNQQKAQAPPCCAAPMGARGHGPLADSQHPSPSAPASWPCPELTGTRGGGAGAGG